MGYFIKMIVISLCGFYISTSAAEEIKWTKIEHSDLPKSVALYKGLRQTPALQIFYLDVDLNDPQIAIRPYIRSSNLNVAEFCEEVGAYAAVNGGFFSGNTPLSSVIYPNEIKAINVQAVTRNGKSYPVIRSLFSQDTSGLFHVDWIYHFDQSMQGVYRFDAPLPYSYNASNPLPTPSKTDGKPYSDILLGIGGAPTLIKDGQINITYDEEIMWGSGVGYDNRDPRTAVGFTANNHVIMLVADGRQSISEGVGLPELAQILLDLGCVEAMNLDGGGSTQMAVNGSYVNSPSEHRAVPSILALVHKDSLDLPKTPLFEKIIDTENQECELKGEGWFPTANSGYYGTSATMLHTKGDGSAQAVYRFVAPYTGVYEVYAWWVAASNRCQDTPFIVNADTICLDQTKNGSQWVLVGKYTFEKNSENKVIISNKATKGTYVAADAIRFVTYDTLQSTSIAKYKSSLTIPKDITYFSVSPNPFNIQTKASWQITRPAFLAVSVYDLQGRKVKEVPAQYYSAGSHFLKLNFTDQSSGLYFLRLQSKNHVLNKKIILLK